MEDSSEQDNDYNFRDKRVDRALDQLGYTGPDIFYSPLQGWIFWTSLLLILVASTIFWLLLWLWPLLPLMLCLSYLFNAYRSNNFALSENQLIIINPNFPFRKVTLLDLKDIESVRVDCDTLSRVASFLILAFGNNYIEVKTAAGTQRFYCAYLQQWNAYSRNLTEKGIDDLDVALKKRGIATIFGADVE